MDEFDGIIQSMNAPKPNTWFLTVTLKPSIFPKPAAYQFVASINPFIKILEKYCYDYSYVTELTEHANVHYHAWIELRNNNHKYRIINEFKKDKVLGFCKINTEPIYDTDRTYAYMLDEHNKKIGKNLKAAYDLIQRKEIAGSKNKFNIENKISSKIIQCQQNTLDIKLVD